MKPFNTFEDYKSAILSSKGLAKSAVKVGSAAEIHAAKQSAIDLIFQARNNQSRLIDMARRDYPQFNWNSLI